MRAAFFYPLHISAGTSSTSDDGPSSLLPKPAMRAYSTGWYPNGAVKWRAPTYAST